MRHSQREIVAALERWSAGTLELTTEQRQEIVAALIEVVRVLDVAPGGVDPVAGGVWYQHERRPALARLSDALHPQREGAALQDHVTQLHTDQQVIAALQRALSRGR